MRCSECHVRRIALWAVDGTWDVICLRCLWGYLDMARVLTLEELLRKLRGEAA